MENIQFETDGNHNEVNILGQIFRYLRYWYWFLISMLVCFFVVKNYLSHTIAIYESKANIKIIDDSKNNFVLPSTGIASFSKTKVNLENQIEVLKSKRLLEQVVRNLSLNTQYYKVGYLNNIEIWKNRPFNIEWMGNNLAMDTKSFAMEIEIVKNGYKLTSFNGTEISKTFSFNSIQTIKGIFFKINLQVGTNINSLLEKKYLIRHAALESTVIGISNSLKIFNKNESSDILTISLAANNKDRSEAILNEIIKQYDIDGLNDRRLVSERTIEFVNNRFKSLERELDSIENNKASYKRENELTYIEANAGEAASSKIEASNDVFQTETQIALSKILEQTVKADKKLSLLPTNIGVSNGNVNGLLFEFNQVVLERDRILISAGENNPKVAIFNGKLQELQKNIIESVKAYQRELEVSLSQNNLTKKNSTDKFRAIPTNEKILNSIERQRNIKESLYILLLQKREEAAVNLAITASSIKVVDYALTDASPIAPKKGSFYLGALLVGLLVPFLILYVSFLLDDKLHTKDDILKLTRNKVILSEIPHIDSDDRITSSNDRSVLGESFRILRTNLTYIFPLQQEKMAQTIMVASTIKGEGKTFTTLNLSVSFSILNKKVLLIGADMRNPQLHNYLTVKKNELGLQDYLHNVAVDWHSVVKQNQLGSLDIILSGTIPPNPAELLSNGRLDKLIAEAKKEYDYIIIDTAPTLLVTDTLIISQLVDTTLYVVRADYTPKKLLEFSVNLSDKGKLKNMAYLINNVGSNYKGYGYTYGYNYKYKYKYAYGYGYGYDNEIGEKVSFVKRLFSIFKK